MAKKPNIKLLDQILIDSGYVVNRDFDYNYINPNNKKKIDVLIKNKNNNYAIIKIKKDKKLTERSIKLFIKSIEGLDIKYAFFTDLENVLQYNIINKTCNLYPINNFPAKQELFEQKKSYKKLLYIPCIILLLLAFIKLIYPHFQIGKVDIDAYLAKEEALKTEKYENCLKRFSSTSASEAILDYQEELNNYFKKYSVSIYYENIEEGINYSYNKDKVYYAASTIKLLDALYLYEKYINNELDLNKELTYKSSYARSKTDPTIKLKNNSKVSLNTLLDNLLIYSDNTAHNILINYIGFNNLKKYGNSLGAKYTLVGGDDFGSITVSDAHIYLKKLNEFLAKYPDKTKRLYNDMISSHDNYLKTDEYDAAVKYGYYDINFHNIGIIFTTHPYYLIVLTHEGTHNYSKIVKDISQKINKLHEMYYEENQKACYNTIYN